MWRVNAVLACAAVLLGARSPAIASPVLELTGGISGGGFNARVVGTGPESAYFNPGLLPLTAESFDVSFFTLGDDTTVTVDPRPAGVDVGRSIYDAWLGDGQGGIAPLEDSPLATGDLSPRQEGRSSGGFRNYLGIGMSKRLVEDKVVFGFLLVVPIEQLQGQQAFFNDEREQYFSNSLHFELYEDRLDLITFSFAAGSRISKMLSVGVGFSAGIETEARTPVYVPDGSDLGTVLLDSEVTVDFALSPHFGVVARPNDRVLVSATLHTPTAVTIKGRNELQVANGVTEVQEFAFTSGYEPLSLSLGGAVDVWTDTSPLKRAVTAVATGTYRTWSRYEDRHGEHPGQEWKDTVQVAAGGRYRSGESLGYVDATFVPSPVPRQSGRSNYVDNHRVSVTTGIRAVTEILGVSIKGGFQLQAHQLIARHTSKNPDAADPVLDEFPDNAVDPTVDPSAFLPEAQGLQSNNPGYPGFSSEGWIFGAGITMSADF
jgi:hypothetical protein